MDGALLMPMRLMPLYPDGVVGNNHNPCWIILDNGGETWIKYPYNGYSFLPPGLTGFPSAATTHTSAAAFPTVPNTDLSPLHYGHKPGPPLCR